MSTAIPPYQRDYSPLKLGYLKAPYAKLPPLKLDQPHFSAQQKLTLEAEKAILQAGKQALKDKRGELLVSAILWPILTPLFAVVSLFLPATTALQLDFENPIQAFQHTKKMAENKCRYEWTHNLEAFNDYLPYRAALQQHHPQKLVAYDQQVEDLAEKLPVLTTSDNILTFLLEVEEASQKEKCRLEGKPYTLTRNQLMQGVLKAAVKHFALNQPIGDDIEKPLRPFLRTLKLNTFLKQAKPLEDVLPHRKSNRSQAA